MTVSRPRPSAACEAKASKLEFCSGSISAPGAFFRLAAIEKSFGRFRGLNSIKW
jgi:hypothetical protein